jgi:hypothetical protein
MNNYTNVLVAALGQNVQWVNFKLIEKDGKLTKIPYFKGNRKASSTNPNTWKTYAEASKDYANTANGFSGVGIIFTPAKTLLGIDIDHVLDENGKVFGEHKDEIEKLISEADTYTEISPSGTGLHLLLLVPEGLPLVANRQSPFEAYTSGRFFTVTEKPYGSEKPVRSVGNEEAYKLLGLIGYPWSKNKAPVPVKNPVVEKQDKTKTPTEDSKLLTKMFASKIGVKIKTLFDGDISAYSQDESRADLALCSHLAFWTGKDAAQMERIWLASPLGAREKTQKREDYRAQTISTAIERFNETYGSESEGKTTESQADLLIKLIDSREGTVLFHDEQGDTYIAIQVSGHQEVWSTKSKNLKRWLASEFYKVKQKGLGSDAIRSALGVIEGRASFEGPQYKLNNRSAWSDEALWYDLTNEKWQSIKIDKNGWEIVDKPPILFRRYSHSQPQVVPTAQGDVRLLLKYVNIQNPEHKLLLLVFLITCFIPDFAHVILVIFGAQGASKSTLSKILRRINDPSMIEVASMPDNNKELIQALSHHSFLFFDNVSYISETTSDILCKAVTGSGFPKRELYSDDEDIIYSFKRCIGINGINLVGNRPDLLERSLLLQLDRIEEEDRKQEKELMESFEKDLPLILGGVFDVLVKALSIKPEMELSNLPRMADFAAWGCAISVALGYSQDDFLKAYKTNISQQTETVLNENIVAIAIMAFMEDRDEWEGTPSELLRALNSDSFEHVDIYEKYWPKGANILMRRMNELAVNLKAVGITFVCTSGTSREVLLKKFTSDDTDGISSALQSLHD